MYTRYFDLKEAPFTIAPNPAYLFMSDRHREALAHLTYGLGDTGGFVLLTGEVGTGKTTICRSVMEQLPENTQAVFILNPTLSSLELLATICEGLKIRYKKTGATVNYFTDKILTKLTKNHQENINTLLVIDEAQHLQAEVLEQLRLLTNLETNTKKLLQVILIGQPELQQLLQRRDLRQLAQRITARYHLLPLTKAELTQYIKHRLSVAECTRSLFTKSAIACIHQISKGIPRVVNLLCERSLIIAYGSNNTQVSRKIVKQAAVEALGAEGQVVSFWWKKPMQLTYLVGIIAATLLTGYWLGNGGTTLQPLLANTHEKPKATLETSTNTAGNSVINESDSSEAVTIPALPSTDVKQVNNNEPTITPESTPEPTPQSTYRSPENEQVQSNTNVDALSFHSESSHSESEKVTAPTQKRLGYIPPTNTAPEIDNNIEKSKPLTLTATPDVSEDMLARFQAAIEATDEQPIEENNALADTTNLKPLSQMPLWIQQAIPKLTFEMHLYASDGLGWVRVNGEDKYQGDTLSEGLILTDILPQHVVLTYQGEQFTMSALSSW